MPPSAALGRAGLPARGVCFIAFVFAALLLNAAISGNLSGIYDRYESRLVWLVALGLIGSWPLPAIEWVRALRRLRAGLARRSRLPAAGS